MFLVDFLFANSSRCFVSATEVCLCWSTCFDA